MGCPLFNGHIGDGHFSAQGSEVRAASVGRIELTPEGILIRTGGGLEETVGRLSDVLNVLAMGGAGARDDEAALARARR